MAGSSPQISLPLWHSPYLGGLRVCELPHNQLGLKELCWPSVLVAALPPAGRASHSVGTLGAPGHGREATRHHSE